MARFTGLTSCLFMDIETLPFNWDAPCHRPRLEAADLHFELVSESSWSTGGTTAFRLDFELVSESSWGTGGTTAFRLDF